MVRVLIVDELQLSRKLIARVLTQSGAVAVVGEAGSSQQAHDRIAEFQPDVVVVNADMPGLDAATFLDRVPRPYRTRVVLYSGFTAMRGAVARALAGGDAAVDKPNADYSIDQMTHDLIGAIRDAAPPELGRDLAEKRATLRVPSSGVVARADTRVRLIAVGASTGGTTAVDTIVRQLTPDCPAVVVVQHLPEYIVPAFAERLNRLNRVPVEVATDGARVKPGHVLVAPGHAHLTIERSGYDLYVRLTPGAKINGHRPSVDALFFSVSRNLGKAALGVLLTGMGRDGAEGLLAMRKSGSHTLAQDEESSIVWGMPQAAIDVGAAAEVLSLSQIADRVGRLSQHQRASTFPQRRQTGH